ncbi:MAG: TolB family protein [Acidimicrobiia bacterium]
MPSEVVAVTTDGRVVVLDSATGAEQRTLAEGALADADGPAVATDGKTVYFMRAINDVGCDSDGDRALDPVPEIARVSVNGGAVDTVATGVRYPALSPDGRYLAYTGVVDCSDAGRSILVQDLTQQLDTPQFDSTTPELVTGISGLSWAPNSRDLLFVLGGARDGGFPRVLDTSTATPLDQTPLVLIRDGSGVDAYLGNTSELLGTYAAAGDDPDQSLRVTAIDPVISTSVDGAPSEFRELFRFPEQCCGQEFSSDASGNHILGVSSTGDLYRWSTGDAEPTKIDDGITAAVWNPDRTTTTKAA